MAKRKPKAQTVSVKLSDDEAQMLGEVKTRMRGKGKDAPEVSNTYAIKQALRVYLGQGRTSSQ